MPSPSATAAPSAPVGDLSELELLATGAGQLELAAEIHRTSSSLGRGELTVAVLGQFKRGKSSLLNALAGRPVLPTGLLPTTAVATSLVRGPTGVRVTDAQGVTWAASLDAVADYVSEQRNPGNVQRIARVEVSVPLPAWADGITFVDSPGVGSAHDANTAAARSLLPTVDAAVFVLAPDPPITAEEVSFLAEAKAYAAKVFFVVNKIDLLSSEERVVLQTYLRQQLSERCGFADPRLYPCSAALPRGGRRSRDPGAAPDGGVGELAHALEEYLGARRHEVVRTVLRARTRAFALRLRAQLDLALRAERLSDDERAGRVSVLGQQISEVRLEHQALEALMAEKVRRLAADLPARIERARQVEVPAVARALGERLETLRARTSGGLASAFDQELRGQVVPAADRMARAVTDEVSEAMRAQVHLLEERLRRWTEVLRTAVADGFGVNLPPLAIDPEPLGEGVRRGRVEGLFEGTLLGQTGLFLPAAALRARLRGRLGRIVEEEFEAQGGRLRSDLSERIAKAWATMRERLAARLDRDLKLIEQSVAAGQAARDAGREAALRWRAETERGRLRTEEIERAAASEGVAG